LWHALLAIQKGAIVVDANETDGEGLTLLMRAASTGDRARVAALLAQGADPSLVDRIGETALLKAAAQGHREVFDLLIAHAGSDERDAALAFLKASGRTDSPAGEPPSGTRGKLVEVAARTAKFFGHEDPQRRVERVRRAEKTRKR
jgi:uncharacterized protein